MDLLQKIDIMLSDTTVAGDVATNTAKGHIDVVGGKCPDGMVYDKNKKVCVPVENEGFVYVFHKRKNKRLRISDDPKVIAKYKSKGFELEESFNESDRMKLSHKETKAGKFLSNVWTLELPEPIPEFGNTKYSSGTKSQMKQLAKKYGRKYGWTLEESSVVGGSYIGGTTNIAGSSQTRVWGRRFNWMVDLDRKEPIEKIMKGVHDPAQRNIIGRRGLTFDDVLGAYVPKKNTDLRMKTNGYFR